MSSTSESIDLFEREGRELIEFLGDLPANGWETPSACEGWTVADVVGHLASVDLSNRLVRGLDGDYSPPAGSPTPDQHDEDSFARSIYQRAIDASQRLGGGLLDDFAGKVDEAVALFRGVEPDQWDNLVYWPPGPMSVRVLLTQRIAELTMHGWDIRSRLEEDHHLSDGSVVALLDTVDRAARRAFRPDPALATNPIRYRFLIDQPDRRALDLILSDRDAEIVDGSAEPLTEEPTVTYRCDSEACVLIMYGRLTPADAMASGRLDVVSGDERVAATFGDRFVGG